ncbi:MAG: hypothetical protein HY897_00935 [Deltaproteobacteria bacterium]|nr:hypothetical protein [Deltaproteobacteria bacterium]
MNNGRIAFLLAAAAACAGCSRVDGVQLDGGVLADGGLISGQACKTDLQCGSGRYCNAGGICSVDCTAPKDCVYMLDNPASANTFECSACGRCINAGEKDESCVLVSDLACGSDSDCTEVYGDEYKCRGKNGACARVCEEDDDCRKMGRGFHCGSGDGLCYRMCTRDLDCVLHGWHLVCGLPAGLDGDTNTYLEDPVESECVPREGGVDWGANVDPEAPAAAYHGIWGMELNTAVRTFGLPLINQQDTVSNQYLLTKIMQDGNGIVFNMKWCTLELKNFKEDDGPFTDYAWIVVPDRYADHIFIQKLHSYNVPEMAPGASFLTDRLLELRGARLANPETDKLPNWDYLVGDWDQARDAKPGMTTSMTGAIAGEFYNAQRWTLIMTVNVVDKDHIQGLIQHTSLQNMLGASKPEYVYDTTSIMHPQADRSFFKAVRLPDTASCADVDKLHKKKGSWIYFNINDTPSRHYDPGARP